MVRFKKNVVFAAFCCIIALSFSSCASILTGNDPKIRIEGEVDEPVTITTEKKIYKNVTLPTVVQVKRHGIDGQRIKIKSENYYFKDIVLEKTVNAVTFGNILAGGLIGWGVDLATNCVSVPRKKLYEIEGTPKDEEDIVVHKKKSAKKKTKRKYVHTEYQDTCDCDCECHKKTQDVQGQYDDDNDDAED